MQALIIPDDWKQDAQVLGLQQKIGDILPDYKTKNSRWPITINKEDVPNRYTGLMENWIYEYKKIPTLLVEFEEHGKKENRLINISRLLP